METVGLSRNLAGAYPHELDGGRRQRIGIARALALDPKFIVCDEPVSALDVSVQAQILNLMQDLQQERALTYLFITHNLSVVKHISTNIMVMYLGKVMEFSPGEELFEHPTHPYTQALLSAIPVPDIDVQRQRILLKGEISSPSNPSRDAALLPAVSTPKKFAPAKNLPLLKFRLGTWWLPIWPGNFPRPSLYSILINEKVLEFSPGPFRRFHCLYSEMDHIASLFPGVM